MIVVRRQPRLLGSGIADFLSPLSNLLAPKSGRIIETAGKPAALSMGVVVALGGAILLIASLKKKRLL